MKGLNPDRTYEVKRNALIPEAKAYADKKVPTGKKDAALWNQAFLGEMTKLAVKHGLQPGAEPAGETCSLCGAELKTDK